MPLTPRAPADGLRSPTCVAKSMPREFSQMRVHPAHREVHEVARINQLACSSPDATTCGGTTAQVLANDHAEVIVSRIVGDAICIVETFDNTCLWSIGTMHKVMSSYTALLGYRAQVLRIVQQRDRIEVRAQS